MTMIKGLYTITFTNEKGQKARLQSGIEEHALRWTRHIAECLRYPVMVVREDFYIESRSKTQLEQQLCESIVVGETFCTHCKLERKDYKWKN